MDGDGGVMAATVEALWLTLRVAGLPLAANIFSTASLLSPFAPRPYTVSVGKTTSPPSFIIRPPKLVPFSYCVTAFAYCVFIACLLFCRAALFLRRG